FAANDDLINELSFSGDQSLGIGAGIWCDKPCNPHALLSQAAQSKHRTAGSGQWQILSEWPQWGRKLTR
ncbi:MAG TPA: hypothetical protein VGN98_12665, partial [Tianweitania sediminis]|nr:hypothetical protein [Tianweitania sediminis]